MGDTEALSEKLERVIDDLVADWERGDERLERAQVDRLYLKRGLSPEECLAVEASLVAQGIEVIEPEEVRPEADPASSELAKVNPGTVDVVGMLIRDARRYPLLNAARERELGRAIQMGEQLRTKAQAGEIDLSVHKDVLARADQARATLMASNIRLVISCAKPFRKTISMDYADLVQEGMIGLARAAEKYNPAVGTKFSTYATWWIRQAMSRGLQDRGATIRYPVHVQEQLAKFQRAKRKLQTLKGIENPTPGEIAQVLGWDDEFAARKAWQLDRLLELRSVASLDAPMTDDDATLVNLIADEAPLPDDLLEAREMAAALRAAVEAVGDARDIDIVKRRFGFDGPDETLEEIGQRYNVTRERIRQLEARALRKLKHPSRGRRLREHL